MKSSKKISINQINSSSLTPIGVDLYNRLHSQISNYINENY